MGSSRWSLDPGHQAEGRGPVEDQRAAEIRPQHLTESLYRLTDPLLHELAIIVRGADTDRLDIAPQAAGLLAISLGLSQLFPDDHELLARGFLIYDALYAWLQHAKGERHTWNPQRVPAPA